MWEEFMDELREAISARGAAGNQASRSASA